MTLKQFKTIKLIFVVLIAVVTSQSIVLENYVLPIIVLAVSFPVLLYLRKRVKEVVADERDYITGGRSAMFAIQVYSCLAVIIMIVLYAKKDLNPSYEPIAATLAYSTCVLMLLYSLIFHYYDKFKMANKKVFYIVFIVIIVIIISIFSLRLLSGEDDWLCKNGEWVKHGNPSFPVPAIECK